MMIKWDPPFSFFLTQTLKKMQVPNYEWIIVELLVIMKW